MIYMTDGRVDTALLWTSYATTKGCYCTLIPLNQFLIYLNVVIATLLHFLSAKSGV